MKKINILIIEDESEQIKMYEDVIEHFNKKNEIEITYRICVNFIDGETALRSPNYDAAIIDLKLSSSDDLEGRKLVESVYKKIRIPIFVYSGSIAQIDDIPENVLLRKRLRTDLLTGILSDIVHIYNTGITTFLRLDGSIDKILTQIFWNHLSDSLFDLTGDGDKALIRYISSHIQEFLEMDSEGSLEDLHPAEFFILPPIKKYLSTGDIIRKKSDATYHLLLTPACDIVLRPDKSDTGKKIRNATKALLIELILWNTIENFKTLKENTGKSNDDRKKLETLLMNKKERYHFLPPYKILKGYFADFQSQQSIEVAVLEDENNYERIATISQSFLKDIIARFSQYYSRQGQPDLLQAKIYSSLVKQNT